MKIIPYEKTMREAVIDLCIRNFSNNKPKEYWETVIDKITEYHWINNIDNAEYPFRNGMVLINETGSVVGYMGMIFSKQKLEEKEYIVVNATTLVIEKEYGIYLSWMLSKMHSIADIVLDISPIPPLKKILKERMNYISAEDEYYSFYPVLPIKRNGAKIRLIKNENEISDKEVQQKYIDHIEYGVSCLEIKCDSRKAYILFKNFNPKKNHPFKYSNVLFSSDNMMVKDNIKNVIWYLFTRYKSIIVSDKRFVGEMPKKKYIRKHQKECLVFSKENIPNGMSYLYTEMPMILL